MTDNQAGKATPPEELRRLIMDPNRAKSEQEHWAARHIEQVESDLAGSAAVAHRFRFAADILEGMTDGIRGDRLGALIRWALHGQCLADEQTALILAFQAPWIAAAEEGEFNGDTRVEAENDIARISAEAAAIAAASARSCRICGCTETTACLTDAGPCGWASPDLCTACRDRPEGGALAADVFAYAYRYPGPKGGAIRFNTGGQEINGSRPIETIRLFREPQGDPAVEMLRRMAAWPACSGRTRNTYRSGFDTAIDLARRFARKGLGMGVPASAADDAPAVCIDCLGGGGDAGSRHNPCPTCGKARDHG